MKFSILAVEILMLLDTEKRWKPINNTSDLPNRELKKAFLPMIKIKYSKKRLKSNLKMGLFFVSLGIILIILSFITGDWKSISLKSIGIGQLAAGIFMLITYYYEYNKQYLTLKNGELIKNTLIPKKIKHTEIKYIEHSAVNLKLITEKRHLLIDPQIVDPNSLKELKNELKKQNLIWN